MSPKPERLYLWGELPPPPWVAIVGTRSPSEPAAAFARELAGALARSSVTIVSGGALGIDTAAHEGALCAGGRTVVVAPSSYQHPYPAENAPLFERVLMGGGGFLALDEDAKARQHSFFPRNHLLVACCELLVVVEAPWRSGARNAAARARQLGRPLFVVPHPPWHKRGRGCLSELKLGAKPLTSFRDVLATLVERGWPRLWHEPAGGRAAELESDAPQLQLTLASSGVESDPLLAALAARPLRLDELQLRMGLPASVLMQQLSKELLAGRVCASADGSYFLARER
jgi:DNA processing protein